MDEAFFHKIVMIRNNLRFLEQKVNASDKLSEADKFDLQLRKRSVAPTELYALTRCYGSLTTFNILFKTGTTNSEPARWTGRTAEIIFRELYWDRPQEEWPRTPDGGLAMYTRPLDLDSLLAAAESK